jgi:hypothetical protein
VPVACPPRLPSVTPRRTPPPRFVRLILVGFLLTSFFQMPGSAHGQCGQLGPGDPAPNIFWALKDSVSGCPAADSLVGLTFPPSVGPRPSRLRIRVYYSDINECP